MSKKLSQAGAESSPEQTKDLTRRALLKVAAATAAGALTLGTRPQTAEAATVGPESPIEKTSFSEAEREIVDKLIDVDRPSEMLKRDGVFIDDSVRNWMKFLTKGEGGSYRLTFDVHKDPDGKTPKRVSAIITGVEPEKRALYFSLGEEVQNFGHGGYRHGAIELSKDGAYQFLWIRAGFPGRGDTEPEGGSWKQLGTLGISNR